MKDDKPSLSIFRIEVDRKPMVAFAGRVAKRKRPSQAFSVVPHGTETDANREFAPDRDSGGIVWFLIALPIFMTAHAICVKIGAI
jgi:hypothetical protein